MHSNEQSYTEWWQHQTISLPQQRINYTLNSTTNIIAKCETRGTFFPKKNSLLKIGVLHFVYQEVVRWKKFHSQQNKRLTNCNVSFVMMIGELLTTIIVLKWKYFLHPIPFDNISISIPRCIHQKISSDAQTMPIAEEHVNHRITPPLIFNNFNLGHIFFVAKLLRKCLLSLTLSYIKK